MNATARPKPVSPLPAATFVVTRPAGTGAALARAIRKRGGAALTLPGLSLRALQVERGRSAFDDAVFVSPSAVRFALRTASGVRRWRAARLFAVGPGTAAALARHGLSARVPSGRSDSESLLAMPELARVHGRRIALVGAPGGRDRIEPELRRRGARVERVDVYERRPPRLTRRHFAALEAARDPVVVLLSSGEALANLAALVPARLFARLKRARLVVSSARLAALAREHGFRRIAEARSASPRDLLEAAEAALRRR